MPRKSLILYIVAVVLFLSAIAVCIWHVSGINERSDIRSNGQKTTGMAMSRSTVRFPSFKGEIEGKPLIGPQQGTLTKFDSIVVYYDKNNPKNFILDQDESPYNITLWIVVVKLAGVGAIMAGVGYWYQRKANKIPNKSESSIS